MTQSIEENVRQLVKGVASRFLDQGIVLATAESCTGGWVAQVATSLPGSSNWFDCGFVTYSNSAKQRLLAVPAELFADDGPGAVSEQVVKAMALGAIANSAANVGVATSGIAGPDGGTEDKPVGTVWIGCAHEDGRCKARVYRFEGDRYSVRLQTVEQALKAILNLLDTTMLPR
ncbi:MAG: CinA family protein [Gammaproteobacteria bacterium]|nr:CinA family protein [Gammaproteobacteria bacterium]